MRQQHRYWTFCEAIKEDPEMNDTMEIIVNGQKETVPGFSTLSFLIHHFKEYDIDLIVEHNGRFVYPRKYTEITVREGDRIEFVNPNFGG